MSWLSFLTGLMSLILWIANYLHEQGLIGQGEMAAFQKILKGQADDLDKKLGAMAAARKRISDSGGVLPPDFKTRD